MNGKRVSVWVKLFVLFHVIAITVWAIPDPPDSVRNGKVSPGGTQWIPYWNTKYLKVFPPISLYESTTGFWQYWDMFAPDPARTDTWCDAIVTYKDGSSKRYQYPRMYLLSIPVKYIKERYRKYYERAGSNTDPYLWPSFAERIALLNDNLKNPPVDVKLYRHWRPVAPPGMAQQKDYNRYMYYEYIVDPKVMAALRRFE